MNLSPAWSKINAVLIVLLICIQSVAALPALSESLPSVSCGSPEHGQFDFWIGDWDAFDIDSVGKVGPSKVARVQVERILDGCVLREQYEGDTQQKVRVWSDAAVVTAKLWSKGKNQGRPFEHQLWFSDIYVRTPAGWRYVFGQASLPLPKTPWSLRVTGGR